MHGLIKIKSNVDLSPVDRRLSYFRVDEVKPNLTVHILKDFEADVARAVRLAPNFFGNKDEKWIYYDRPLAWFKLRLLVKELLGKTEVLATSSYLKIHFRIGKITPLWELVPFIMDIKFLKKGYTFLHGGCLSKKGKGILFSAFPNTGKTFTALLSLKAQYNFAYLSDDITIIDDGGCAYCYPEPHRIFAHARKNGISKKDPIKSLLKLGSSVMKFRVTEPTESFVDLYSQIKNPEIIRKTEIENIFFLEDGEKSVERIDHQNAYKRLLALNRHEFPFCTDPIILSYAYFNPELNLEELSSKEEEILSVLTDKAECFILRSRNPTRFIDLIESIV